MPMEVLPQVPLPMTGTDLEEEVLVSLALDKVGVDNRILILNANLK